ncbi:DUF5107 domain-containing protein [Propionibacteriaceae bacterium G1746]|uniref:DUF5107 domain-containing protein n=1 Tax=Aestuariimicrobium sp. G57 TaxID=3418485 RepID=UPI003C1C554C
MTSRDASATVRIIQQTLPTAGPDPRPGLPILNGGGGRLPSESDRELLAFGDDHLDRPPTVLPWRNQSRYDRDPRPVEQRVAVLENEHLRATFLLDWGGRLWTLTDLASGRELLHQADAIQPANLALRNAWFAGGVEWNLGVTGHWALTCEPVSAAVVEHDGVQVLRMWAHERMLELVWRMDVWLPAGATALTTHVTLTNPHAQDRPVYWWSNVAVPQAEGGRVLVDARSAFNFGYTGNLRRVDVPVNDGDDVTVPTLAHDSADYFFETRATHPWIAAVDSDGHGLAQASTAALASRKLFVWGTASGGTTWQQWLSGSGAYTEIQAGLAPTQLEHLRLPAGQTWSWTETYRGINLGADVAAAPFDDAVASAARVAVDAEWIDTADRVLRAMAAVPVAHDWQPAADKANNGWGALAVAVGDLPADAATPFLPGSMDAEQRAWADLASTGVVDASLADSVQTGAGWAARLEATAAGPVRDLLLGYAQLAARQPAAARESWQAAVDTAGEAGAGSTVAALALRALAVTAGDQNEAADLLTRLFSSSDGATLTRPGGAAGDELLVEWLTALHRVGRHADLLAAIEGLGEQQRQLPRVAYLDCAARVGTGDLAGARELLDRPLVLPDLREGDLGLDQLWDDYQRAAGTDEPLPAHYDFRMHID